MNINKMITISLYCLYHFYFYYYYYDDCYFLFIYVFVHKALHFYKVFNEM